MTKEEILNLHQMAISNDRELQELAVSILKTNGSMEDIYYIDNKYNLEKTTDEDIHNYFLNKLRY